MNGITFCWKTEVTLCRTPSGRTSFTMTRSRLWISPPEGLTWVGGQEDTLKVDCSKTEVQTPTVGFSCQRLLLFTSGVVLLDKHQGFWLVHSTPHFPPAQKAGQYYYPGSGLTNGQNFICVTYPLERFQTIGKTEVAQLAWEVHFLPCAW